MPRLADVLTPTDKETEEFTEEWKKKNREPIEKPVHFFDKIKTKIKNLTYERSSN